jgi:hypothetical protein
MWGSMPGSTAQGLFATSAIRFITAKMGNHHQLLASDLMALLVQTLVVHFRIFSSRNTALSYA